jgi:hypothetical protein
MWSIRPTQASPPILTPHHQMQSMELTSVYQGDASVPTHPNIPPAILVGGWMFDCQVHQSHSIDVLDSQNLLLRGLKFGVGENPGFM